MWFTKGNKDAVIALLIIIVLAAVLYPYIDDIIGNEEHGKATKLLKEKRFADKKNGITQYYAVEDTKQPKLFPFDPNTADSTQLLQLGLSPWQVRNIYKYRAKGGRYRKPSDFARLYGLTAKQFEQLLPYITIEEEPMAADVYGNNDDYYPTDEHIQSIQQTDNHTGTSDTIHNSAKSKVVFSKKIKEGEQININTADTTLLKQIPGIGSYYARQIVQLRQRLGGFYSIQQCKDIEDFPIRALPFMSVGPNDASKGVPHGVNKIKINRLTAMQLSRHPYIRYAQAKHITEYRQQAGFIRSADELRQFPSFTAEDIRKLAPYLDFE